MRIAAIGVFVAGALLIAAPAGGSTAATLSSARILEIALRAARLGDDAHPTYITMAAGPAKLAAKVLSPRGGPGPGYAPDAESVVYLVAMHGRFIYNGPQPPREHGERQKQAPSTVLELIIDGSGHVAASAWRDTVPVGLSHLGPVTQLHYPGEPATGDAPEPQKTGVSA